ncbi:Pto-interacting protein 1 [Panicum miliaceum]|uniref:Pto-interacting protein 1 n=1 Tax=Panicum miliaceum TaxID=4540 RepID=A0A3L6R1S6_PANMI|nr:Pto-interacting protein 1 [Panicum miliaceum]
MFRNFRNLFTYVLKKAKITHCFPSPLLVCLWITKRVNNNYNLRSFAEKEIEHITNGYSTLLGKGAFGEVYKGVLDDQLLVAVKKYKDGTRKEDLAKEVIVHSQINHKNVVRLMGCCTEENALAIVMELIRNGNLGDLLHHSTANGHVSFPLYRRLSIPIELAEVLSSMHSINYPINSTKKEQPMQVLAISLDKLKDITRNFSSDTLVGQGSRAQVFLGELNDSQKCAVKMLDYPDDEELDNEFLVKFQYISRLEHNNVVQLLSYCIEGNVRAHVYEYLSRGSLHDILHGIIVTLLEAYLVANKFLITSNGYDFNHNQEAFFRMSGQRINDIMFASCCENCAVCKSQEGLQVRFTFFRFMISGKKDAVIAQPGEALSWARRLNIALSSAEGLEFIHEKADHHCISRRVIKSSNILLFDNDVAKIIGDITVFEWNDPAKNHPDPLYYFIRPQRSDFDGYGAPEYAVTGQLSNKRDVFSFGVVLLELLTGRKAFDRSQPRGQENLVSWATAILRQGKVRQCADPRLGGEYPPEDVAKGLLGSQQWEATPHGCGVDSERHTRHATVAWRVVAGNKHPLV